MGQARKVVWCRPPAFGYLSWLFRSSSYRCMQHTNRSRCVCAVLSRSHRGRAGAHPSVYQWLYLHPGGFWLSRKQPISQARFCLVHPCAPFEQRQGSSGLFHRPKPESAAMKISFYFLLTRVPHRSQQRYTRQRPFEMLDSSERGAWVNTEELALPSALDDSGRTLAWNVTQMSCLAM
jgi:hypothetical protein